MLLFGFLAAAVCIISMGCGEEPGTATHDYAYLFDDPAGSISEECCGVEYTSVISGTAPPGGRYYWQALVDHDTLVVHGEPVFVDGGPFVDVALVLSVSYLDQIPESDYRMMVFASESLSQVGDISVRDLATTGALTSVVSYTGPQCVDCCSKGLKRYRAMAAKQYTDLIGASAYIETRYGLLCADGTPTADTAAAQQGCWVGIQDWLDPAQGLSPFAQIGWMVQREGSVTDTFIYIEMTGAVPYANNVPIIIHQEHTPGGGSIPDPVDGTTHRYEVLANPATGSVGFIYDQTVLANLDGSVHWTGVTRVWANWQGEINGRETDMPGTVSNKCSFNDCQYTQVGGVTQAVNFLTGDLIGATNRPNRPPDFGIAFVSGSSGFHIWDIYPLIP